MGVLRDILQGGFRRCPGPQRRVHLRLSELTPHHSEYELEQALLANVRKFLTEIGGAFTFVGNQYRLEVEGNEYFIDLLLYHRALQSLVAIELKIL
jgi:predicted nuclease of restriction endonuclease-like (RecB) superfamily